ncbi:nitroreductase [Breznakia sp. PF5-3]|uniref:nitroreductase family protein n=1 Tax=unclassified Breznakia TaxID=2623764 RepID=UPI002405993C|nr:MULTISPECIES: nitroreductase family protein [unclassified Breznakia]MDF9825653.1 nitroreductase [Breznakia sp. PM6-1]MDF9836491.1 nitroreductase [Breznakia sp. PF5-3]
MLDVINKRFSAREYTDKQVENELLEKVLIAAQLSPTWKNKQCFEIICIDNKDLQLEIGELANFNPSESAYKKASHLLVFIADPTKSGLRDDKPYYMCDSAIAIEHSILEATSLGLGTCWVGVFPEQKIKKILHIPEHLRIVAMTPLGYTSEAFQKRPRREIKEIVHWNKY